MHLLFSRGLRMQEKFNQYYLRTELAKKYSHSTYLAYPSSQPEHQVVLTVFTSPLFYLPYEREKLLRKAQHIKKLQHQHLTAIMDMGIEQEQPFIVREYLPNQSLRSHLKSIYPHRLQLREALAIVSQVGQCLAYMHEHNIFHGNIKPENILFDANDQAILTDFNLVDRTDAIIRDQSTEEYAFCYMAPEQFAGICNAQSDQYALGCLAYELITGRLPFAALMMGQSNNTQPAPLSQSVADLPSSFETAVLKTMAKDPAERFFDFSLFLEVIQSALFPQPTFPLVRSTYARNNSTTSRPLQSIKALADGSSAKLAMTTSLTKEETDGLLLANLSMKKEEHGSLVITPASSVYGRGEDPTVKIDHSLISSTDMHGPRTLSTIRRRRSAIRLTLLLSVIAILIIPILWLVRMSTPNTSLHITQKMTPMVPVQTATFPMTQPSIQVTTAPTVQPSVQVTNTLNIQSPAQITTTPTAPFSVYTPPSTVLDTPISYEAEASDNTLTGSALVITCPPCSGGERVGSLGVQPSKNVDGSLQFNHVNKNRAGTYTLTIYFTQGDPGNRITYISVNGDSAITCQAASTGSWYTVATVSVTVSLNADNNTIEVFNPSSNAPDIDRIVV
jgi:serine/threonine protein kinase